jgi:hypothetical protein
MSLDATPATHVRQTDSGDPPDTQLYRQLYETAKAAGLLPHHRAAIDSVIITTPDASDLATSKTLCLAVFAATYATNGHFGDDSAHDAVDPIADPAAFTSAPAEPADLAETQATANEMKADFIAHQASVVFHDNGVGGQGALTLTVITTADGSTQGTTNTLLNALKAWFNLHVKLGAPKVSDPQ